MQFTATIKKGPVYTKWMKLDQQGGVLHGTTFTRVNRKRSAIFVAHEIVDLEALKNDPNVEIEMTTATVHPNETTLPEGFVPDALSQGIVPSRDATENPAHTTREDVPADFVEPPVSEPSVEVPTADVDKDAEDAPKKVKPEVVAKPAKEKSPKADDKPAHVIDHVHDTAGVVDHAYVHATDTAAVHEFERVEHDLPADDVADENDDDHSHNQAVSGDATPAKKRVGRPRKVT